MSSDSLSAQCDGFVIHWLPTERAEFFRRVFGGAEEAAEAWREYVGADSPASDPKERDA